MGCQTYGFERLASTPGLAAESKPPECQPTLHRICILRLSVFSCSEILKRGSFPPATSAWLAQ